MSQILFRKISTSVAFSVIFLCALIAAAVSLHHLSGVGRELEEPLKFFKIEALQQGIIGQ